MDTQRIRYFLEVARQKNFSRAASLCRVSQPSLSQQIRKLEAEVGGALFIRSHGATALTEFGEQFLRHAQAIMAEINAAEDFVSHTRQLSERTIRFGAIPTIGPFLIPEIFEAVRRLTPRARLELIENRTEPLVEALASGQIDFALLSPPTAIDAECDHLLLGSDEFLLTLPQNHPLAERHSLRVEQLAKERILLLENAHCLARQTAAYCEEVGLQAEVTIRGSQIDTLLGLVEKGFGLTFTPALAARSNSRRKVVFRSIAEQPCHREIRLAWLRRHFLPRSHQAVLDAVTAWSEENGHAAHDRGI